MSLISAILRSAALTAVMSCHNAVTVMRAQHCDVGLLPCYSIINLL